MDNERLLGHLIGQLNRPAEPTATAGLTFVLGRSQAAASALLAHARSSGVRVPDDLNYVAESAAGGEGRPDITGYEGSGASQRPRLIVEAKFGARLASDQIPAYLRRFADSLPSVLVLLAPQERLPSLWHEALSQLPDAPGQGRNAPAPSAVNATTYLHSVDGGHALVGLSWTNVLHSIREQVEASADADVTSDVRQLESLVQTYEQQAFLPILEEDFDPRSARLHAQTVSLLWKLRDELSTQGVPYSGNMRYGLGWMSSNHMTRQTKKGSKSSRERTSGSCPAPGPLWISVWPTSTLSLHALATALAPLDGHGGPGLYVNQSTARVPLRLKRNSGQADVLSYLVDQVLYVAELLDAQVGPEGPGVEMLPPIEPDESEDSVEPAVE